MNRIIITSKKQVIYSGVAYNEGDVIESPTQRQITKLVDLLKVGALITPPELVEAQTSLSTPEILEGDVAPELQQHNIGDTLHPAIVS